MKSVIDQRPWLNDPLSVRKPWAEDEYKLVEHGAGKQLCFAIISDYDGIKPHPPILRGLQAVKDVLLKAGHQGMNCSSDPPRARIHISAVIDWEALRHQEIFDVGVCLAVVLGIKLIV